MIVSCAPKVRPIEDSPFASEETRVMQIAKKGLARFEEDPEGDH